MSMTNPKQSGRSLRSAAVLALLIISTLDHSLDFALYNAALPKIIEEFQTTPAIAQWALSSVYLSFGMTVMIGGKLIDIFGARRMMLLSIVVIFAGAMIGLFAQDMFSLVIGRFLQGAGRAILNPCALMLVTREFGGEQRNGAIAITLFMQAFSAPVGLMLGAWQIEAFGWRSVQSPALFASVCLLPLVLALAAKQEQVSSVRPSIDYPGAALCAIAVSAVIFGATQIPASGVVSVMGGGILLVGVLTALALPAVERRQAEPVLPPTIFRLPNVTPSLVSVATLMGGNSSLIMLAMVYLQGVEHRGGFESGLLVAAFAFGTLVNRFAIGWASARLSPKQMIVIGAVAIMLGDLWLCAFIGRASDLVAIVPPMFIAGSLGAMGIVTAIAETMHSIPEEDHGIASALVYASQKLATATNIALVMIVATLFGGRGALDRGAISSGFVAAALLTACGIIYAAWSLDGKHRRQLAAG